MAPGIHGDFHTKTLENMGDLLGYEFLGETHTGWWFGTWLVFSISYMG